MPFHRDRRLAVPALLLALVALWPAACGARPERAGTRAVLPLVFTRSGGIAGVRDGLRVGRDGHARVTHRGRPPRSLRLGPRRLGALRGAIRAARLPARAAYPAPPGTADAFAYRIAAPGHVVTAEDGGGAPPRIRRLIGRLSALVGR